MRQTFLLVPLLAALAIPSCATTTSTDADTRATTSVDDPDLAAASTPDLCASLASDLAELLAAAQSCNVAAANPTQCANWVPGISGCAEPVAYAGSEATLKYLEVYELYAQSCPLPDRPCVDTTTLTVECSQDADNDSLVGRCSILD